MTLQEELARVIDPGAWKRRDVLVGFIINQTGADQFQETYGCMWRAGVRDATAAHEWLLNDGTRVGWELKDSLALAQRILDAGYRCESHQETSTPFGGSQ